MSPGAWVLGTPVAVLLLASPPAAAWQIHRTDVFTITAPIAVDAHGNVLFTMPVNSRKVDASAVVKLARRDGSTLWRRLQVNPDGYVSQIAVSAGGATFVGGSGRARYGIRGMLVARLSGRDGRARWRTVLPSVTRPSLDRVRALVLDAHGDVIAGGTAANGSAPLRGYDFTVVKLAGDTGRVRWRWRIPGGSEVNDAADAVTVTGDDDVIAAGATHVLPEARAVRTVVKLAGDTGRLTWRRNLDGGWSTWSIAVDTAGDVFVASATVSDTRRAFEVLKLAGTTGEVLWEADLGGGPSEVLQSPEVLPSGDVVVLGLRADRRSRPALAIVRLNGRTGRETWRRRLRGRGWGSSMVALPGGDLVVGGRTRCGNILLARLAPRHGTVLGRLRLDATRAPGCGSRGGAELAGLAVDRRGRVIVAGTLARGSRRTVGFVTTLPPEL